MRLGRRQYWDLHQVKGDNDPQFIPTADRLLMRAQCRMHVFGRALSTGRTTANRLLALYGGNKGKGLTGLP